MKRKVEQFDLRPVDFATGKRIAATRAEQIQCECCGKWICKGWVMDTGQRIGTECATSGDILRQRTTINQKGMYVMRISKKQAEFFGVAVID
jgi:hypothetical protein